MSEKYKEVSIRREDVLLAKDKGYETFAQLIKSTSNSGDLVFILENTGSIPPSFGRDCFVELLKHDNKDVRLWAVKNLGKFKSKDLIDLFKNIVDKDPNTTVKREAVSSIGRLRSEDTIPVLLSILINKDPKIVCQAIRGLLVFKGNPLVDKNLKKLINHENEMVISAIKKEYYFEDEQKRQYYNTLILIHS